MRVVFNGSMEMKKSGGCSSCGKSATGSSRFVTSKAFYLPSGARKTFTIGKVEEVSDRDGRFLLSYVETTSNGTRRVFEEA